MEKDLLKMALTGKGMKKGRVKWRERLRWQRIGRRAKRAGTK